MKDFTFKADASQFQTAVLWVSKRMPFGRNWTYIQIEGKHTRVVGVTQSSVLWCDLPIETSAPDGVYPIAPSARKPKNVAGVVTITAIRYERDVCTTYRWADGMSGAVNCPRNPMGDMTSTLRHLVISADKPTAHVNPDALRKMLTGMEKDKPVALTCAGAKKPIQLDSGNMHGLILPIRKNGRDS